MRQQGIIKSSEFGSERIPRSGLWGKQAFTGLYSSLRIEDSPRQALGELQLCIMTLFNNMFNAITPR